MFAKYLYYLHKPHALSTSLLIDNVKYKQKFITVWLPAISPRMKACMQVPRIFLLCLIYILVQCYMSTTYFDMAVLSNASYFHLYITSIGYLPISEILNVIGDVWSHEKWRNVSPIVWQYLFPSNLILLLFPLIWIVTIKPHQILCWFFYRERKTRRKV